MPSTQPSAIPQTDERTQAGEMELMILRVRLLPSVPLNHFQNGFQGIGETAPKPEVLKIFLKARTEGRGTNLCHT